MIILEKPYVSDFLVETIKKNNFSVLDNSVSRGILPSDFLISDDEAKKIIENGENLYSNSENSIDWVLQNLDNKDVSRYIQISKNKALFRRTIKEIYPDYCFAEISRKDLSATDASALKFPLILKPSVGFLSFGVYPVESLKQWENTLLNLNNDIEKIKNIFPQNVVDTSTFIVEEMIEGDEYAIDAYYDENGESVILNIFKHPFFDGSDVSDRVYYTSKSILLENLEKFKKVLDKIGHCAGFKNFPFHLELRANEDKIIPIEINPLRFCGWCITDIAQYAWGINVYEYYFKKLKPDWKNILQKADESLFYFTIGDIPAEIDKTKIKEIDYEKFLKNIQNPLVIRKIDAKNNPVFAIVFAKTKTQDEIKNLLKADMRQYIIL